MSPASVSLGNTDSKPDSEQTFLLDPSDSEDEDTEQLSVATRKAVAFRRLGTHVHKTKCAADVGRHKASDCGRSTYISRHSDDDQVSTPPKAASNSEESIDRSETFLADYAQAARAMAGLARGNFPEAVAPESVSAQGVGRSPEYHDMVKAIARSTKGTLADKIMVETVITQESGELPPVGEANLWHTKCWGPKMVVKDTETRGL